MLLVNTSVKSSKKRKKNKRKTPQERFESQWRSVQTQIKRNEDLRCILLEHYQSVKAEIQDPEEKFIDVVYAQTQKLLIFCKKKSLSNWHRVELYEWVSENIDVLDNSPFAIHLDLEALKKIF